MSNSFQYTGSAYIRANGKEISTKEGAKLTPGGMSRTPVVGSRVYGFQQSPKQAQLECTILQTAGISLFAIRDLVDATIEFECDTGERFMLANAWCDGNCTLTDKGEISALFMAIECKEI